MDIKKYIHPILATLTLSGLTLFLTITRLSPCISYSANNFCDQTSILNIIIFFTSNFIFLTSAFLLFNFLIRIKVSNLQHINHDFNTSLRQGILLSMFANTCIIFIALNILTWWSSLILLTMTILTEFLFLQKKAIN